VGATAKAAQKPGDDTRGNSHYPRKKDNPGGLSVAHREGKDLKEGLTEELRRSGSEWQQVQQMISEAYGVAYTRVI
jgi:hypothetical protein